jgi:hypothetical protein
LGPTVRRPSLSTAAIEPPPAPISIISMTGMRIGMPEPLISATHVRFQTGERSADAYYRSGKAWRWCRHIEGKNLGQTTFGRDPCGKNSAASRTRLDQPDRKQRRRLDCGHTTARSHHQDRTSHALGCELIGKRRQICGHQRLDICVGDGGTRSIELPRLWADI